MSKVNGTLFHCTAAVAVLLLGAVCASAEPPQRGGDSHDSGHPPAPPAAPAAPHQAPRPAGNQGAPRPAVVPNRGEGQHFTPAPAAAPQQPQPPPQRFVPTPQGGGGHFESTPAARPPGGVHSETPRNGSNAPPANTAGSRGGPRFVPRPGAGPGGGPGVARTDGVRAFHGAIPGQYRGDHQGQWHGPPPGVGSHRPPHWNGGNWRGSWWPRVYYDWTYPLFLATLPGVYATYWWGDVPYYYVNNVYYTWSAPDSGYVVTDPPPTLSDEDLGAIEAEGQDGGYVDNGTDAGNDGTDAAGNGPAVAGGEIYAYPRNGQNSDVQARDKYECHQWARQQSGYDPTSPGYAAAAGGPDAYRRAMIACLEARGYSAR